MEYIRILIRELLYEAINFEFEQKGGLIVFSTDVNANADQHKFVAKIRSLMATIHNRMNVRKKATAAIMQSIGKKDSFGFTLGHSYKGRFFDAETNLTYDEKSYTLEIIGVSSQMLQLIARNISKIFNQKMVLVKDYETGKMYMEDTVTPEISFSQPDSSPAEKGDYQMGATG